MKTVPVLLLLSVFITIHCSAQQSLNWTYTLNCDYELDLNKMVVDTSGNVYTCGTYQEEFRLKELKNKFPRPSHYASFFLRFSNKGKLLWGHPITSGSGTMVTAMAVSKSGLVAIAGFADGNLSLPGQKDTVRLKMGSGVFYAIYSAKGEVVLAKALVCSPGSRPLSVGFDSDGNVCLYMFYRKMLSFEGFSFESKSTNYEQENHIILKFSAAGKAIWQHEIGMSRHSSINPMFKKMGIDSHDNILISGAFKDKVSMQPGDTLLGSDAGGSIDSYFAKFDSRGKLLWKRQISGDWPQLITDFDFDSHDNIYLIGHYSHECILSTGIRTLQASKFDANASNSFFFYVLDTAGELQTARYYNEPADHSDFCPRAIAVDKNGNSHIFGIFQGEFSLEGKHDEQYKLSYSPISYCNFSGVWDKCGNILALQTDIKQLKGWARSDNIAIWKDNVIFGGQFWEKNQILDKKGKPVFLNKMKYDIRNSYVGSYAMPHFETASCDPPEKVLAKLEVKTDTLKKETVIPVKINEPAPIAEVRDTLTQRQDTISKTEITIKAYPNPCSNILTLQVSQVPPSCQVEIYGMSAQILFSQSLHGLSGEQLFSYDVSSLAPGPYFIRFSWENQLRFVKFVKM